MAPKGRCVLWWCNNRQWHHYNTKYYSFPLDEERLKMWLQAIGRNPNDSRPSKGLCSHHFSPECFELKLSSNDIMLKENAVPNVNLYPTICQKANKGSKIKENDIFDPHLYIIDKRTGVKQIKCCVSECEAKATVSLPVYMFPKSQIMANLWKATLNIKEECDPHYLRVCADHFDERDIIPGTKQLSKLAVPSISVIDPEKKAELAQKDASVYEQITSRSDTCTCKPQVKKSALSRSTQTASFEQPVTEEKLNSTVISANSVTVIIRAKDRYLKAKLCSSIRKILKDSMSKPNAVNKGSKTKQKEASTTVDSKITREICSTSSKMAEQEKQKEANGKVNLKIKKEVEQKPPLIENQGIKKKYVLNPSYKLEGVSEQMDEDLIEQPTKIFQCPFCGFKMKHSKNLVSHVQKIHYNLFRGHQKINEDLINELAARKVDDVATTIIKPSKAADSSLVTNKLQPRYEICEHCGQLVRSNRIKIHLLEVHGPRVKDGRSPGTFVCSICKIQVHTKEILNYHMKKHHKKELAEKEDSEKRTGELLSCKYCQKTFPTNAKLRLHEELHSEVQFRCPSCPKKFKGPFSLLLHRKHQHTDSETQNSGILVATGS